MKPLIPETASQPFSIMMKLNIALTMLPRIGLYHLLSMAFSLNYVIDRHTLVQSCFRHRSTSHNGMQTFLITANPYNLDSSLPKSVMRIVTTKSGLSGQSCITVSTNLFIAYLAFCRYCWGGAMGVRLGSKGIFDSLVICHPAPITADEAKAITIPTSWVCAERQLSLSGLMKIIWLTTFIPI